ncbi:Transcriptional regulatory protein SrrA [Roseivivax sp. THAF40]|uniref:response regulator n=1 Tax=Roseivivax sp. THAF40 TaxID=2587858 RepID=UPI0012685FE7|nr:response regulator transcription factor [Roseivivax sp. THAF40]QFT47548.1 Transcriptional regulatory protein SrrA [Roseivivax sp. THAF40]
MKILIVDDDVHACEILEAYLHEVGYSETTIVTNPDEAYSLLNQGGKPFDCILLDIVMPEKNGIELCRDIRTLESYKNTPIIMITAMTDKKFIDLSFRAGAFDYITKPFELLEVSARMRVAQRSISERKAAMDSYLALRLESSKSNDISGFPMVSVDRSIDVMSMNVESQNMVSLRSFESYLEKLTRSEGNNVQVAQIQISNIDALYSEKTAEEFLDVLSIFIGVLREVFELQDMFVSHIGMGTFIFSMVNTDVPDPDVMTSQISSLLAERVGEAHLDITIGEPIQMYVGSPPNFDRLIKVAKARIKAKKGNPGLMAMAS